MKFTIDTENKTISFDSSINAGELVKELKKLFPNDWKEYELIGVTYSYPVITYPSYQIGLAPNNTASAVVTCGCTFIDSF